MKNSIELLQTTGGFKARRLEEKAFWHDEEHIVVSAVALGISEATMQRKILSTAAEYGLSGFPEAEMFFGECLLRTIAKEQSPGFTAYIAVEDPGEVPAPLVVFDGEQVHLARPGKPQDGHNFSTESLWLFRRTSPNC